ncbi:MAG: SusC/RagA family TonB-linked outer membrane protein [Pseudomonadales bacterium]
MHSKDRGVFVGVLTLVMVLFAVAPPALAQQTGAISGRVTDQNGVPLQGARVFLQGTNRQAITDLDGRYRIRRLTDGPAALRAVAIGYTSVLANLSVVGGIGTADFVLRRAVVSLDDIIVTATGEQRKREVANAVGTIEVAAIAELKPQVSLDELLVGQSPGVTVMRSSGTVGVGSSIKIRGNSSISLSNTPLIYVDGARIDNSNIASTFLDQSTSRLNDINPDDIERIEIVKGPAASTLYGTEAAGGVIRIFTKRGRSGPAVWNFRTDLGANVKNTRGFDANVWDPASFGLGSPGDTLYSMNLLDEFDPFRRGMFQSYEGSVRGGTDRMQYYISGQFQDEKGTLPNNEMQRFHARANFTIRPQSDVWDLQLNGGYTSNFLRLPDNDNDIFGYIGVAMIGFPWNHRILASDPNVGGSAIETCPFGVELARDTGLDIATATDAVCPANNKGGFFSNRSFEDVEKIVRTQDVERFIGSGTFNIRPTHFWTAKATLGYDLVAERTGTLFPVDPTGAFGPGTSDGLRQLNNLTGRNLTIDLSSSVNYDLSSNIRGVTSVGVQYFRTVTEISACQGEVFPAGATTCSSAVTTTGDEAFIETKTLGVFVQQQISINDRLFLTPALRMDDNSAFGEDFELAKYPKVGASYVAIDQSIGPIDQAKVRVAWGKSGKQPQVFAALQRFAPSKVTFRSADVLGVTPLFAGNLELKPETGEEWEIGFDASLLDHRVGVEFTYYTQKTKDAIVSRPLAPSLGFPNPVFTNIARIDNKGIEIGLSIAALDKPDWKWDWAVNFSTNENEIKNLDEPIIFGLGGASQRHTEGRPFASYFTERVILDASGDAVVDSTLDPDDDDHVFHGHPTPEWEGSVSQTLNFLDYFTVHALLDFKGGHQLFNSTEEFRCGFLGGGETGSICPQTFERGVDGEFTDDAKIKQFAAAIVSESPWIEDADFAKLRTVSIRFDFPNSWARTLQVSRASITLAGHNLKTWTGYSGSDPEINFAGQSNASRADFLTLPTARRFTGTFRVTF